ncbi:hypothetical protein U1Q18_035783 [Sarracenia purpurea var. burkii]
MVGLRFWGFVYFFGLARSVAVTLLRPSTILIVLRPSKDLKQRDSILIVIHPSSIEGFEATRLDSRRPLSIHDSKYSSSFIHPRLKVFIVLCPSTIQSADLRLEENKCGGAGCGFDRSCRDGDFGEPVEDLIQRLKKGSRGRKIPNRAQIRTEVISVQIGEDDSGGFGAGKRREEETNQSPSGEDERRLAQLRRWVFLVDWSKLLDRRWVSVENKVAEGHRGSGSVSAQGGRRQQWA